MGDNLILKYAAEREDLVVSLRESCAQLGLQWGDEVYSTFVTWATKVAEGAGADTKSVPLQIFSRSGLVFTFALDIVNGESVSNAIVTSLASEIASAGALTAMMALGANPTVCTNYGVRNYGVRSCHLNSAYEKKQITRPDPIKCDPIKCAVINGFREGIDKVELHNDVFSALTETGTLLSQHFYASADGSALADDQYLLYNTTSGGLLYDADGSGEGLAVELAVMTNKPRLTADNFHVVS